MHEPREDVLTHSCGEDFVYSHVPQHHWRKIWRTNLLERVNVAPRGALCETDHQPPHPRCRHRLQRRRYHPPGGRSVLMEHEEHWQLEGRRRNPGQHRPPHADDTSAIGRET
jgi:hypothetical protein